MNLLIRSPYRQYFIIASVSIFFALDFFFPSTHLIFFAVAIIGSLPVAIKSIISLLKKKITIDTFNLFALVISFFTLNINSAGFIVLMLAFADLLDWRTESRATNAVSELLKLKPSTALREKDETLEEVSIDQIQKGEILIIKMGARIPVDGIVVYGSAYINESSVTGESDLVEKVIGDRVVSSTLNESGVIKIKATDVGKDSTIERMALLIGEAAKNKSHSEKIADKFAGIFLPIVLIIGIATYLITKNISMTAAIFLVACADDMSVAIPLAVTAALGKAARRGVIIKGGEWLSVLAKIDTVMLDKTGTLTYGSFVVKNIELFEKTDEKYFWQIIGVAEKYSEHPIGRVLYREALKKVESISDPEKFEVYKSAGVSAQFQGKDVFIGSEKLFEIIGLEIPQKIKNLFLEKDISQTRIIISYGGEFIGMISIADVPRNEASESIKQLKNLGIKEVVMLTGDTEAVAIKISQSLGITNVKASLSPDDKLKEVEKISQTSILAMVGDGINDAPALARADVGIAMGSAGTAVAVEAADVVILTDNLNRLPEMVELSRKTMSVIKIDTIIWLLTNTIGFGLVFTGVIGPALAAFYNFATDFLPLINSARLFKK
ncbi:MAG: cation-translocating P-type ATPase [Candidatus Paceibacterota bacterium]|jgi:heavy metal translocating P-type ATPase